MSKLSLGVATDNLRDWMRRHVFVMINNVIWTAYKKTKLGDSVLIPKGQKRYFYIIIEGRSRCPDKILTSLLRQSGSQCCRWASVHSASTLGVNIIEWRHVGSVSFKLSYKTSLSVGLPAVSVAKDTQHSTAQHSTVQYSTAQHSEVFG